MITLNVNIDHIATIRQARGGLEPDPVTAALIAELAGASGIVCHLREDRRHINDRDLELLRRTIQTRLDLEMAAVEEIIQIAFKTKPELVTIVPEKRQELTTEGGLDVAARLDHHKQLCQRMHEHSIEVSLFIEPILDQVEASHAAGADMVELHTGTYALAKSLKDIESETARIRNAARLAADAGMRVAAGHGLNYLNVLPLCSIGEICEFSIGHAIISRAVLVGIERAVKDMVDAIEKGSIHSTLRK